MNQAITVATIKEAQKKAQRGPHAAFAAGAKHWMPPQPPKKHKAKRR